MNIAINVQSATITHINIANAQHVIVDGHGSGGVNRNARINHRTATARAAARTITDYSRLITALNYR